MIKAIPTTYGGTRFRSRLEARWAAFFDLAQWRWDYEPFDLDGWAPDFMVQPNSQPYYAEVKPVQCQKFFGSEYKLPDGGEWEKAARHWKEVWVLCLGAEPQSQRLGVGFLMDPPQSAKMPWWDASEELEVNNPSAMWREAGNRVQWVPA